MTALKFLIKEERGNALLLVIVVVGILTMLSAAFVNVITNEYRNADWQKKWVQEFYLAEGGLNKGIALVKENWLGGGDGIVPDLIDEPLGNGTYSVHFDNTGDTLNITSTGTIPGITPRVIGAQLLLSLSPVSSVFAWAAFGGGGLTMTGSVNTDSYNSDNGPYGGENIGENGSVGSNGDIKVTGSATIKGNATCGPDPDDELKITGSANITGSTEPLSEEVILPSLDINFPFPPSGELNGSGTYTLTDGTYCFTNIKFTSGYNLVTNGDVTIYCESASFTGTSQITVNGKLTFYCTGNFTCTGSGIINTSQAPEDFILYCTGGDIKLTGSSNFYGATYASNGNVTITGGHDYYGSIIAGGEVKGTGNSKIHYDESLMDVVNVVSMGGGRQVSTVSWRAY
jgi:hypothetical protein